MMLFSYVFDIYIDLNIMFVIMVMFWIVVKLIMEKVGVKLVFLV